MNFIRGLFPNKRADLINSAHILQLNYEAALLRESELRAKLSRSHVKRDAKGRFVSDKPVGLVTSSAIDIKGKQ